MALAYGLGARVRRREDPRLVTGSGTYVDDLRPPGLCHLGFVRSYLPHASVRSVEVAAARASAGVIAVITAAELGGMPTFPQSGSRGRRLPLRPLLNEEKVSFAGDLIAFVMAESREQAQDGGELVSVELEPLPPVVDPLRAADAESGLVHSALGTNVADETRRIWGDIDAAFRGAPHVVRARLRNQRLAGVPIEPRGVVAVPNP